jgi:hypothetical protein
LPCTSKYRTEISPESEQRFLVAGLVVVFHLIGEPYPFGGDFIEYRGSAEAPSLPEEVERDLAPCRIRNISSLEIVKFNHVPRAMQVSIYAFQLFFGLEEMDVSSFNREINHLPERFGNLNVG